MVNNAGDRGPRDHRHGQAPTQAERAGAIHAGWNDAAWDRPRRSVPAHLMRWYELGYAGGLIFKRRRQTPR
jgi:hypothetical protein